MANDTLSHVDPKAVRALICYWLHMSNSTEPSIYPDFPDVAVTEDPKIRKSLADLETVEDPSLSCVFGEGVDLGITLALLVLQDPLARDGVTLLGVADALEHADFELRKLYAAAVPKAVA